MKQCINYNNISKVYIGLSYSEHPQNTDFALHTHKDSLEILILLEGDVEFRVEGSVYELAPYDTIIVSNNEMHRIIQLSDTPYKRIVISLPSNFFTVNNCPEYSDLFYGRPLGENNLFPHKITAKSHFQDCVSRLLEYHKEQGSDILINSILIELLYTLNKCNQNRIPVHDYSNKHIKEIISYINENLTSNISLSSISKQFYINKSYLCRVFKQHTGFTLEKYIAHKRILYVQELCSHNMSINQASIEAGFTNYSSFYRMYKHHTGQSPGKDLK